MKCAKGYKIKEGKCAKNNLNSKKSKTRKGFDNALVFISLFGFLVIALNSFTELNLSPWTTTFFMMVAGIGLMIEGRVITMRSWIKDGVQGNEVAYILTIVFGMFMIISGIFAMPGVDILAEKSSVIIGMSAIFSIIFITVQKWIVN